MGSGRVAAAKQRRTKTLVVQEFQVALVKFASASSCEVGCNNAVFGHYRTVALFSIPFRLCYSEPTPGAKLTPLPGVPASDSHGQPDPFRAIRGNP